MEKDESVPCLQKKVTLIIRHHEPLDRCHLFFKVMLCCLWSCINLQVLLKYSPQVQQMGSESIILENVKDQQVQSYCRADLPPSLLTARAISREKIEDVKTIEQTSYHIWKGSHS